MTTVALKQLLRRQQEVRELVTTVADALGGPLAIEDSEGQLLHGEAATDPATTRHAVSVNGTRLGWVAGPDNARAVAALLDHLAAAETERRALGAEVLHLYREVNIIYSFSEKLAALLDLERVATLTLQQARQLIVATDGVIMLLDENTGDLTSIASFGDEMKGLEGFRIGRGIIGAVAATGLGEIVNDVDRDDRRVTEQTTLKALICAPLTVGERVIGVLAVGSTMPMAYTAAELKLLTTLALQSATAIENARLFERTVQAARERERLMALHQAAELARAKLESEMTLAARIQADLFPAVLPKIEGYELAARNRPARHCGGDYYDALPITGSNNDDRLLMCVADVSGKGMPASLLMSNMQATLRALLGHCPSLRALAGQASDLLYAATSPEKYVTAALAELHPKDGVVHFVGAGHLDNLVVRRGGGVVPLASTGPPLGLLPPGLPYGETTATLDHGDALVLFSDGITDAQNDEDDEFGEARLREVLQSSTGENADTIIDRIFDAIDEFASGAPQFDDMTVLVTRRLF